MTKYFLFALAGFIALANASATTPEKTASASVTTSAAAGEGAAPAKIKYKAGKDLSFDELIIEGQLKRPDLNVVTGETEKNGNGLLRLRENFLDRMTAELGEEAP